MGTISVPIIAIIAGGFGLLFSGYLFHRISKIEVGDEKVRRIGEAIRQGAMAFLSSEYRVLGIFVGVVALILFLTGFLFTGSGIRWETSIAFLMGALASGLAGYIGMVAATRANMRTALSAKNGMPEALRVAFSGGAIMGMSVVGLGLMGLAAVFLLFKGDLTPSDFGVINGFALGASSIALFARVGGGIYTKAADVGADLVGKVEAGIPEDDPRNPAVIADNVGDNVGDTAGMGADLFESFVGSIIAATALGGSLYFLAGGEGEALGFILYPLLIASFGTVAALIGNLAVAWGAEGRPEKVLRRGNWVSGGLVILFSFFLARWVLPGASELGMFPWGAWMGSFFSVVTGLLAGLLIGTLTEYYTSNDKRPVQRLAQAAETGPATVLIEGLALGMASTGLPILILVISIGVSYSLAGLYGIALAALGMLSITGMTVAVDAYGPIADNAGGIAEMAGLPRSIRSITDTLDSVGNTTAAVAKGFAIGSAALTALALFSAYTTATGLASIDLVQPRVISGLLIGACLPFLFSSVTMRAVGRAAFQMIGEVRRQFREITGIMEGEVDPDYARCVTISTVAALREMFIPGILAILVPLLVGLVLGPEALGGLLAGSLATGILLAVMMANSGGAFDNAKKYIEAGNLGGKGTPSHSASVVGDTVGDPLKDTSGPSLNILIKLLAIVALVFAPLFI